MNGSKKFILRNGVMVAPQSLNLLVGVRVPIPQPNRKQPPKRAAVMLFLKNRDSNQEGATKWRKKSVRGTVFADAGNERKRGEGAKRAEKSLFRSH